MHRITNKTAEEQIKEFGFTLVEVKQLGLVALNKFLSTTGVNIMNFEFKDLLQFYRDVIANPAKYREFAEWIRPRFDVFVNYNFPMRIYVGGEKQFMQRGDKQLEKSLRKASKALNSYISGRKMRPDQLSLVLYYLNLMG